MFVFVFVLVLVLSKRAPICGDVSVDSPGAGPTDKQAPGEFIKVYGGA